MSKAKKGLIGVLSATLRVSGLIALLLLVALTTLTKIFSPAKKNDNGKGKTGEFADIVYRHSGSALADSEHGGGSSTCTSDSMSSSEGGTG